MIASINSNQKIDELNRFRELCISNALSSLKGAKLLAKNGIHHLAYHLALLALEESGKIPIAWQNHQKKVKDQDPSFNIPLDDHAKKIFWALFSTLFGTEVLNAERWNKMKHVAASMHSKRLESLYTHIQDVSPALEKVTIGEAEDLLKLAHDSINIIQSRGPFQENESPQDDLNWLVEAAFNPSSEALVFNENSQKKLIELGDSKPWIAWLKVELQNEQQRLSKLAEEALNDANSLDPVSDIPKWKMKLNIRTPSHVIRTKDLKEFNIANNGIQLKKGQDQHTLLIEFVFKKTISIHQLWNHGWTFAKLFVASLNVASNGFFFWNIPTDPTKYYDSLLDIENKSRLQLTAQTGIEVNWKDRNMILRKYDLDTTTLVQGYLLSVFGKPEFEPMSYYIYGLTLFAKNDIHLRFDSQIFESFYTCFKKAVELNELPEKENVADLLIVGQTVLEKMVSDQESYKRIISIGESITAPAKSIHPINIADILLMKQFCGFYLLTLASRHFSKDSSLRLILE